MGRAERLADEVDGGDAHELDVRMKEQAADELSAAVTTAADDGGLEAFGHDGGQPSTHCLHVA